MELFGTMFAFLNNGRNGRSPNSVIDELKRNKQAKPKHPPNTTRGSSRGRMIKSFSTSTSSSTSRSSTPSLPPRSLSCFNGRTTRHHRHRLSSKLRTSIDESEKSAEIPIPPSQKGSFSSVDNLDRGQLSDVYNEATWRMFERITTGRRRQLEGLSAEVQAEVMSEGIRRRRQLTATVPPSAETVRSMSPSGVGFRCSSVTSTQEPTFVLEL